MSFLLSFVFFLLVFFWFCFVEVFGFGFCFEVSNARDFLFLVLRSLFFFLGGGVKFKCFWVVALLCAHDSVTAKGSAVRPKARQLILYGLSPSVGNLETFFGCWFSLLKKTKNPKR